MNSTLENIEPFRRTLLEYLSPTDIINTCIATGLYLTYEERIKYLTVLRLLPVNIKHILQQLSNENHIYIVSHRLKYLQEILNSDLFYTQDITEKIDVLFIITNSNSGKGVCTDGYISKQTLNSKSHNISKNFISNSTQKSTINILEYCRTPTTYDINISDDETNTLMTIGKKNNKYNRECVDLDTEYIGLHENPGAVHRIMYVTYKTASNTEDEYIREGLNLIYLITNKYHYTIRKVTH